MNYWWKDRLRVAVSGTPGTGTITLGSAATGFQGFEAADDGKAGTFLFLDGNAWEVAEDCIYTHSGTTLTRGTFIDSSSGSALSLTSSAVVVNTANAASLTTMSANGGGVDLFSFFTPAEIAAMKSNSWGSVNVGDFSDKLETVLKNASNKYKLTCAGPVYFKVDRPIRYYGRVNFECESAPIGIGAIFYPDLSVDWSSTYANRGVIESANFDYPTLPPGEGSWPNSKPDFVAPCYWFNFSIEATYDSLYGTYPGRIPDFGMVVHCANEGWIAERVNVHDFRKANWLLTGTQSTPTLRNCGGFGAGDATNTVFGAAVTRTTGGAFSGAVYVLSDIGETALSEIVLEAADGTDIDTIAGTNVLVINGNSYTVSSVGTAETIDLATWISTTKTTTRRIRRVTFSTNVLAYTLGRWQPAGLYIGYHPGGSGFASGITSANGGQGCSGMVVTQNFSGDNNESTLVRLGGSTTLVLVAPKSEYNRSVVVAECNQNGGGCQHVTIIGGRTEIGGSVEDQAIVRILGHLTRTRVFSTIAAHNGYAKYIEDLSGSSAADIAVTGNGYGPVFFIPDGTEMSFGGLRVTDSKALVRGATPKLALEHVSDATNYKMDWRTEYSGSPYKLVVGVNDQEMIIIDGEQNPKMRIRSWNGSAMADHMRADGSGNILHTIKTSVPTLGTNYDLVMNLTSDTNLRISVRGSDGTTRVTNLTLA